MRKSFPLIVVPAIILLAAFAAGAAQQALVAKVNDGGVSQDEFDRNWKYYLQRRGLPAGHSDKSSGKVDELKKELLEDLIGTELLYQEAKKKKLLPEAKAVDEEMGNLRGQFASEEEFGQFLKKNAMTPESLKDFIIHKLAVKNVIDQDIAKDISVSDKEVHDFYTGNPDKFKTPEQVNASHILVKVDEKAEPAAREAAKKKIEGILAEVKAGGDFAELAKKNSECPSSAKGGDLGTFGRGQMVKPFEDTAFALKKGDVSGVVETQFGYHIIKVLDHLQAGAIAETEVAPKIKEFLTSNKAAQVIKDRVTALRKAAKVDILLKPE